MTVPLEDDVKDRLDQLAQATQRSKSFLASAAFREFVETNEWQVGELCMALDEADSGDFASDQEVKDFARKWQIGVVQG
jgi:RHH-type transcriptional regulator, rel operon repressor / antitoxin RelB